MALRRIQDLSSYNLSAIQDIIYIPAAVLVAPSTYRVQKLVPTQFINAVFDSIKQTSIATLYVSAPSASILTLSSNNIFNSDSITSNYTVSNSVSTTTLTSNSCFNLHTQSNTVSTNSLLVTTASILTANISTVNLSTANIENTNIQTNNVSTANINLANINAISATQLTAVSASFNGFAPVAKYTAIINHIGSADSINYTISHPFNSLQVMSQITRITTNQSGVSTAQLVFADIINNGDSTSTVNILDTNNRVFQVTFMS